MLKAGAFSLVLSSLVACGVGDDGSTPPGPDLNGRLCTNTFSTAGSVTEVPPVPDNDADGMPDILGCWPSGKWHFTATADGGDCAPVPTPLPAYDVKINYGCFPAGKSCAPDATPDMAGEYGFEVALTTQTPLRNKVKYSSGGGGLCEGLFELFSDDGKETWNFHPTLNADSSLGGQGEFSRWSANQWTD